MFRRMKCAPIIRKTWRITAWNPLSACPAPPWRSCLPALTSTTPTSTPIPSIRSSAPERQSPPCWRATIPSPPAWFSKTPDFSALHPSIPLFTSNSANWRKAPGAGLCKLPAAPRSTNWKNAPRACAASIPSGCPTVPRLPGSKPCVPKPNSRLSLPA